ncbi:MAG: hypothetical protein ACYDDU_17325 [Dermatophilaceae bacterium]
MAQTRHRWLRRAGWALAMLVGVPILGVAALWRLTPRVAGAGQVVRAHLGIHHGADLAALPSPDRVAQALVATEDSRFSSTPGIDPVSMVRLGLAAWCGWAWLP